MSEKLTKLEWESIAYIVRIVEDRDDISLNQFELIFRALAESLTMQATIDELTRMANEAPGCRCGCRSIDQTDQIAELYRQISTVEAELNERKGQAMVWESDQLIIAKLQEQIEKLAAENLELNHIRAISEGNNYYMEHIGILERRAKQAEDNHEICAGALLAESQRIETMRIENLGAKEPRPKSLRTPKEEYNQIAVDMAQRVMDDLTVAQQNCCDDVRVYHGHCESCGAQAVPASKGNLMRQVKDLVQRNNQQAKYIKELGGVLPLFGAHREASSPVKAHLHDWRNQYSDLMGDVRVAWQQCAGCGGRRDVGEEVDASFEATPELVSDQRAKDFECECPYHSCALATVFYGHCQICGGEWIPF